MKARIKIVFLLIMPAICLAQQSRRDSLIKALKTARTDSVRFNSLMDLGWEYSETNRDTALYFHDQAFRLAKKNARMLEQAFALWGKGYELTQLGKFAEALVCFQEGLQLAEDPANEKNCWYGHFGLGNVKPHALRIAAIADLHHNFGHLMGATGNPDEQITHYRITKALASGIGLNFLLGQDNLTLGNVYLKLNQLDSALMFEQSAERIMTAPGAYRKYLGYVYGTLGQVYLKKQNPALAIKYFRKAISANLDQKNLSGVAFDYFDLTDYYLGKKQKDSSLYYAAKELDILRSMKSKDLDQAYENLYQSYKLAGRTDSAYKYQGLALTAKDSIYKATVKSLADFQKLSFQAQIHAQELEKEKAAIQTKIRTYVLLAGIGVLMLLAGIFYRNNRQKQKANVLLSRQKDEIEEQAREAQIEAALERVRSRTMAMQHSDELAETAYILFQQFRELGENPDQATIGIINEAEGVIEYWVTIYGNQNNRVYKFSIDEPNVTNRIYKAWQAQEKSLVIDLAGKELIDFSNYRHSMGGAAYNPEEQRRIINVAFFSKGLINVQSTAERSVASLQLLERFANVFEITYTRFLDLKNAEAQAREAQIELSLERVRAKTMAMYNSRDIDDVVIMLFDELLKLGAEKTIRCGVNIFNDSRQGEVWSASFLESGETTLTKGYIDMGMHPLLVNVYKEWENKAPNFSYELIGSDLEKYYEALIASPSYPFQYKIVELPKKQVSNAFFFPDGCLFAFTAEPLSADASRLFKRFAGVFGLTYRRFLDLQKAEAQAREARIENSLEKVRSRSLAMHKSDELRDVVKVVFEKLQELSFGIDGAAFIVTPGAVTKEVNIWIGDNHTEYPSCFRTPFFDAPVITDIYDAIDSGQDFFSKTYAVNEKNPWFEYAFKNTDYKYLPEELRSWILAQENLTQCFALAKNSGVGIHFHNRRPLSENETDILKRFSKVFEQSYIRFLDLQKAEAQAREAKIEASLERVRSKAMAMRNSGDLSAAASTVFIELRNLGINPIRSGVGLINGESRKAKVYSNTSTQTAADLALMGEVSLAGHPVFEQQYQSWLKQQNYFIALGGKDLASYYKILSAGLNADLGITVKKNQQEYGHWFMFSEGFLYAWSDKEYTDAEIKILERFKNVIELTFRRYFELQKSETQAREAVRQASLDRVRAQIASMRTTEDLDMITPLIWNELTILGVPFIRCGVFIMNEQLQQIHCYLSTPDGKAIAAFQLPFDSESSNGVGPEALRGWRQKEMVTVHWNEEEFKNFSQVLVEQGEIASEENYLTAQPPTSLDLHFFPFLQGMLYAGNTELLTAYEKDLVQSLAEAFSTAYARYEDFNSLELAKAQVENTLTDLKAAQTQLVQAEKMAYLGELTAGIAHEIQNPLNFVNNFSEVNVELIDELKEEIANGNLEDAEALANDIKENAQKITMHGKRADSIVKGMLEHSRTRSGQKTPTNINSIVEEYMRLSYHSLRAKDKTFNAVPIAIGMVTDFDPNLPKISVVAQDIGRVILNLLNNAFYAVIQKKKLIVDGYNPCISVSTSTENGYVIIKVKDNGVGMPEHLKEKIMQPFFTTKPTGEGTGLGLSLTYDMVVKGHGGEIKVNSIEGEGSEFIIQLPTVK